MELEAFEESIVFIVELFILLLINITLVVAVEVVVVVVVVAVVVVVVVTVVVIALVEVISIDLSINVGEIVNNESGVEVVDIDEVVLLESEDAINVLRLLFKHSQLVIDEVISGGGRCEGRETVDLAMII